MKRILMFLAVAALGIGVSGLAVLAFRDVFFPKPVEQELTQTKSMLRNVFEKNKELSTEVQDLTQKHAEFLKEMSEKEKELSMIKEKMEKQVAYVKTLTKQGARLQEEVSKKPIQRDHERPRGSEAVGMVYPPVARGGGQEPVVVPSPDAAKKMEEALEQVDAEAGGSLETEFEEETPAPAPAPSAVPVAVSPAPSPSAVAASPVPAKHEAIQKEYKPTRQAEPSGMIYPSRSEGRPKIDVKVVGKIEKEEPVKPVPAVAVPDKTEPLFTPEQQALLDELKREIEGPETLPMPAASALPVPSPVKQPVKAVEPVKPFVPEPSRDGGMTPEKAQVYEEEFASFKKQIQELREERIQAEEDWKEKMAELEKKVTEEKPSDTKAQMEKQLDQLQDKSNELAKKVSNIKGESQKDRVDYLYNLGVAYTQGGMYEDAAEMYEKVLIIDPNDAGSHYNLGILYDEHLGKADEGIKHYEAYIKLSKDPEKQRMVQTWIRLSRYDVTKRRESYFNSISEAAKKLLVTTPD